MLTWWQGVALAAVQGVTELFPVSSLGHTVVLPALLGWGLVQRAESFVPFVVLLHLATAAVLLVFYRRDWVAVTQAFVRSAVRGRLSHTRDEHLAWLLFFGTLPTGLLGFLLERPLKALFGTPALAAAFLVANGAIMLATEHLRRQTMVRAEETDPATSPATAFAPSAAAPPPGSFGRRVIQDLTWKDAVVVGGAQSLALLPGISRSGATMCAGLLVGMDHSEAAHYTFMLATPIIAAAGLLEVPVLFTAGPNLLAVGAVGAVVAAVTAYLSVRFLARYFHAGRLDPFAYYCVALGLVTMTFLFTRGG